MSRRRGLSAAAAVGVSVLTIGLSAIPASAAPAFTPVQYGVYTFYDYATRNCLTQDDTNIPITMAGVICKEFNTSVQYQWIAASTPYQGVNLENNLTGGCLDSDYSAAVYESPCNWNNTYQSWNFGGNGPAATVQDYQTGLCLDSNQAGNVYTYSCNWNDWYQNWYAP